MGRSILAYLYNVQKAENASSLDTTSESAICKSNSIVFWEESAFYKLKNSQGEVSRYANDVAIRQAEISHAEQEILVKRQEIAEDIASVTDQVATASMSHLL